MIENVDPNSDSENIRRKDLEESNDDQDKAIHDWRSSEEDEIDVCESRYIPPIPDFFDTAEADNEDETQDDD